MTDNILKYVVWGNHTSCNMNCMHCASSSGKPIPNELSTAESLQLCDELGAHGVTRATLSGGEPFMQPDWADIADRVTRI